MTIGLGSANRLKLAKITTSQNTSTIKNGSGIASSAWREHEQPRPAHVGGDLDDAGFQRGLFRVGRLEVLDRVVEPFGGLADDKGRSAAFARDVLLPDAGGRRGDDFPQQGARRFRFRAVFGQHLVDQHRVGAELADIAVLVVVGVFRRSDHQADHERGKGREKAGAEADGFLGASLEQVGRQGSPQDHADGRADQDRGKGSQKRGGRTHGVITLSWCGRAGQGLLHIGACEPGLPATICCGAADQG